MSINIDAVAQPSISVAFFGRRCPFTAIPLGRLLRAGIHVSALFLSSSAPAGPSVRLRAYRPSISLSNASNTVERIAGEHDVPVYDLRQPLGDELCEVLTKGRVDLIVAACFPWLIPTPILEATRLGGINLHPSLLPAFRGPDPLFWAYRCGTREWGVTVHQLSHDFDTGAILAQTSLEIEDEVPGDALERRAAEIGGELLIDVIKRAQSDNLHGQPQEESAATYQTWPSPDQIQIDSSWNVQHAVNFVLGIRSLGYEPAIATAGGPRMIHSLRIVEPGLSAGETWHDEHTVSVTLADGTVECSTT